MSYELCNKATYNLKTNNLSIWTVSNNVSPKIYTRHDFELTLDRANWLVGVLVNGVLQFNLSASGLLADIVELTNRYVYVNNLEQIRACRHNHAKVYNYNLKGVIRDLEEEPDYVELREQLIKEWAFLIYAFCKSGDTSEVTGGFFDIFSQTTIFNRLWLEDIRDGKTYSVHEFLKKPFVIYVSPTQRDRFVESITTNKWGGPNRAYYTSNIEKAKHYTVGQVLRLHSHDTYVTKDTCLGEA